MGNSQRTAVVTGGASGIGRAIALRLARTGMHVGVLDLDAAGAARVAAEAGARAVEADVATAASVNTAVDRLRRDVGPVHVLVNAAGIASFIPFAEMTEDAWDRMIAVHLKGTYNCIRAVLPDMVAARWGRIVNIASVAGLSGGGPGLAHYAAAKSGIIGLTKVLGIELAPQGITTNAIAPGLIDTPLLERSGMPEQVRQMIVGRTPVGRIGKPEDVAAACAYLVSEEASFVVGQVLSPNGGGWT
ncbi:MAG TPA: SDR family NAD(P)-dependent oxidoreductase [Candidatus Binatia bacterium]|nr:SDR family NAD(P)-dependent oxidoreductase [Candidatus Binatia bacterium]